MSSNFFAALDDSGDEAPAKAASAAKKREPKAKKGGDAAAPESSKPARKPVNNDRNTKHGRGGRAPVRDGKRAYDRRSGTGRGKEIKKGGGGARNWGNDKTEAKKMEGKIDEEAVAKEPEVTEGAAEEAEAPAPEPEPEDNTMTLAEYMASKKGKKEEKTGREVENEFAGKAAAKKEEEDFLVMGGGKSKKKKQQKTTSKVLKLDSVWRPVETEAEAAAVGEAAVKVAEAEVKGEAVVDVEDEAVVGEVKAVVEEDGALASMSW
eukprot:CAMPEP_0176162806 /NCGR_PEP_ID=MMETSP0120_2-20121206/83291_1 /TAXON_ID=160619 /ORGANISM="Kryptoperidinium foliaceum, Strain CCMP 1326" /LENGTH=263 /DNA_ID=CAMNT_0017500315 /DNA_START=173 /DNA_END=962 /DNA_ORIENTATION=+